MLKFPDPKTISEIKKLSENTKEEVVHSIFNGLNTIRGQVEMGLDAKASTKEILECVDKMGDWFRSELKQFGFIGE